MSINEQLKPLAVPIARLVHDPENARLHDEHNLETIQASLREYGQQKPIVVNTEGVVIAGNGTLMAAKALGWSEVAAVVYDGTGEEDGFALADNRSSELGKWDYRVLSGKLRSLKDDGFGIETLGWKDYELEPLLKSSWRPPALDPKSLSPGAPRLEVIKVTGEQLEVMRGAMLRVRDDAQSELSDGRCLELICADFIAGHVSRAAQELGVAEPPPAAAKPKNGARKKPTKKPAGKTKKPAGKSKKPTRGRA